jgi:hypothetical protein
MPAGSVMARAVMQQACIMACNTSWRAWWPLYCRKHSLQQQQQWQQAIPLQAAVHRIVMLTHACKFGCAQSNRL